MPNLSTVEQFPYKLGFFMHERLLDQIGFTRNVKDSFAVEKKVIFFLDRVESSEKHEF